MSWNIPVPHPGTLTERLRNRASHPWMRIDYDEPRVCEVCDCKEGSTTSDYPCGQEPPRMEIP